MDLTFLGPELAAFAQVILIDLVLAGDNAIVVGLAAAGLPPSQRNKVILVGIAAATVLRILFALGTTYLLAVIGLTFAGGILLLWVCWKFWRELEHQRRENKLEKMRQGQSLSAEEEQALAEGESALPGSAPAKTMMQATIQIILADVSMSLDNVLAVAGAAHEHPKVLIFGLILSVALMGIAASFIAKLLKRFHWIAYVGLAVIFYVAGDMIWRGWAELEPLINGA
ncbi:TerC family protein [Dongia sp.]|jgi:YjbE family integral membrane protein|uniref:TerC family protein n=1 Tax=Dongia sp. TaxID=1977262 RepID=UPI0035B16477